MRKPAFCMYAKKGPDQLRGNSAADQRPLFSLHEFNILLHDNIAMGLGHKCSPH